MYRLGGQLAVARGSCLPHRCPAGRAARAQPALPTGGQAPSRPGSSTEMVSGLPSVVQQRHDGHLFEFQALVAGFLPAIFGDVLGEVALGVEEADRDHGQAEVAGAFHMIAGEHAQAAGIDRHGLVQAKLGGEIGHDLSALSRSGRGRTRFRWAACIHQRRASPGRSNPGNSGRGSSSFRRVAIDLVQEADRVVVGFFP